jgi:hypothetical protein
MADFEKFDLVLEGKKLLLQKWVCPFVYVGVHFYQKVKRAAIICLANVNKPQGYNFLNQSSSHYFQGEKEY